MRREIPLKIKLMPTRVPMTQPELDGQCAQIKIPRIDSIPEVSEIERRVEERKRIERIKFAATTLDIAVANIGSAKARQVYVDLILPPEVAVIEKEKVSRIKCPS